MKIDKYFDRKLKQYCWRFDLTIAGQRIRRGGFIKKVDAENAVAALRLLAQRQQYGLPTGVPGYTLFHLLEKLKADAAIPSNRTLVFSQFVELIGERTLIVDLRHIDLVNFLNHLRERELQPGTIGLYLDHVSTFLHNVDRYFSALDGYRPPKFPKRPRSNHRQRVLSKAELGRLFLKMVEPRMYGEREHIASLRLILFDVARLMLLTAARREEICAITAEQINFGWKTINLKSRKTGREHTIAVGDLALEILRHRIDQTPAGKGLFEGVISYRVTRILHRVAEEAEINYGQRTDGGWSLHDFRRTAATVIEDAGIPYSAVMAQLGHKRQDMTARYTIPQLETLRRAAQLLENWCRDIDGIFWGAGRLQTSPDQIEELCELQKAQ